VYSRLCSLNTSNLNISKPIPVYSPRAEEEETNSHYLGFGRRRRRRGSGEGGKKGKKGTDSGRGQRERYTQNDLEQLSIAYWINMCLFT